MAETVTPALSLSIVGDAHIGRIGVGQRIVVAAGRIAHLHRVEDITVDLVVVDAGDRHGLGRIPVGAGKGQAGRQHRAFAGIQAEDRDRDIGARLAGEHHREGGVVPSSPVSPLMAETVTAALSSSILVTLTSAVSALVSAS